VGKSWLGLNAGIAVASGGTCLGQECEQGDVLGLFLEDTDRRLQRRMTTMLGVHKQTWPELARHGNAYTARDHARCTPRVIELLNKTAVVSGGLDSWASIADYENVATAFLESLRSVSVFDAALANGMTKAPLRSRGFSITAGITGSVVPERSVKPISQLTMTQQLLEPKKAAAIIVISKELGATPGAATLLGQS
jgi:hypothetical protein